MITVDGYKRRHVDILHFDGWPAIQANLGFMLDWQGGHMGLLNFTGDATDDTHKDTHKDSALLKWLSCLAYPLHKT